MKSDAESRVLCTSLEEAVAGRRLEAALFTTFSFEPDFFEEEVVPTLLDQAFSHVPRVRLLQLEERLQAVGPVAVYYDRCGVRAGSGAAVLDVGRIGIGRSGGVFHPKVVLLLLADEPTPESRLVDGRSAVAPRERLSLVFAVLSANLTRAGWWENREVVWLDEWRAGTECLIRDDLLDLLAALRAEDRSEAPRQALDVVQRFVAEDLVEGTSPPAGAAGRLLWTGREDFARWLAAASPEVPGRYRLEVVAPYLDATGRLGALGRLLAVLRPVETRVLLPLDDEGRARCHPDLFRAVEALEGVHWGRLPGEPERLGASGGDKAMSRRVHAKLYRLWSEQDGRELVVVGSPNLTRAAHSHRGVGNLEVAVLIDCEIATRGFWLERRTSEQPPHFADDPGAGEDTGFTVPSLTVRFDWRERRATCFWDGDALDARVRLRGEGRDLATLDGLPALTWVALGEAASERIARWLRHSSFLEVRVGSGEPAVLLVREERMEKKPSLLVSLGPAEILQYWSLLSPEQREAFLAERHELRELYVREGLVPPSALLAPTGETLFDRFAGIFHAFGRLREHVEEALRAGREKEAGYRLFGDKYDSLPSFLRKLATSVGADDPEEEGAGDAGWGDDAVVRYVSLLTARQMVDGLRAAHPTFFDDHPADLEELNRHLAVADSLRAGFDFGDAPERRRFFAWFEEAFLRPSGGVR